ncbi:MAG: lamin tail domain-containing protein, partial [candidate division Zixibacteria bacterium]|nr:lamin tail domain-containing protein [candidate division Zixibacteria bacterium]
SAGRLQGFSNQNDINYQVDDPHFHMYRIHSTMSGMLHETMHQWAAFLNNPNELVNNSHWYSFSETKSNYGDSTTSAMEGYMWADLGGDEYQGYAYGDGLSPLDLYVMGIYDTSQVPDRWYLADPFVLSPTDIVVPPYYALPVDLRVNGTPQTLTMQDIVTANGLRTPTPSSSQKNFNMAIILVVKNGEVPKGEEIARIEKIRKEFENYFYVSTGGLATMNTSLYGSNGMELVSNELRSAALGYSYNENVYAVGGTEPYTWSLQGVLPTGLIFNSSSGIISGVPGETGSFPLKFKVLDSGLQEDSVNLILTVSDTGSSQIVINELELWERYNVGAGIELYNKGNKAVDLTNWVLEMNGVSGRIIYTIPVGVILPPQSYLVLLESSGINTSRRLFIGQDIDWSVPGSGFCALKDNGGNGVDFVRYGSSVEPPPSGTFWSGTNPVVSGAYHNLMRDT